MNFIMIIRTLFNKGSQVPLRGKVNEAVTTGVRVVDTILPNINSTGRLTKRNLSAGKYSYTWFQISTSVATSFRKIKTIADGLHFYYNQHGYHLYLQWTSPPTFPAI